MFNTILVSSKNSSGENEYDFLNITSFLALIKGKKMMFSLCDITGKMAMPWVEAGYIAVLVDPQHEKYAPQHSKIWFDGNYLRISCFLIDCISFLGQLSKHNQVVFVSGFPPCTDVAVSGAAHFAKKAAKDKHFQSKAALIAEQCRTIGLMTGAPYFFENPVSVFSSIFGAPQYTFHPYYRTIAKSPFVHGGENVNIQPIAKKIITQKKLACGLAMVLKCLSHKWIILSQPQMIVFTKHLLAPIELISGLQLPWGLPKQSLMQTIQKVSPFFKMG